MCSMNENGNKEKREASASDKSLKLCITFAAIKTTWRLLFLLSANILTFN